MNFYLTRNSERQGSTVTLSNYKPRRNSQYDNFKCIDGTVLHQMEIGTWWYWTKQENQFTQHFNLKDAKDNFGVEVPPGHCIDLNDGTISSLVDAEDVHDME